MKSRAIQYGPDEARRRLEETGFEPAQAELLVRFVTDRAGTAGREMNALKGDMASLKSQVGGLEVRMDRLQVRMDSLEVRMGGLEGRMSGLEVRMARLEGRQDGLLNVVEALRHEVRERSESLRLELGARVDGLEASLGGRMDGLRGELTTMKWLLGVLIGIAVPISVAVARLAFM